MTHLELDPDPERAVEQLLDAANILMSKAQRESENAERLGVAERAARSAILDFKVGKLETPAVPSVPKVSITETKALAKAASLNPHDLKLQARARAALDAQWNSANAQEAARREAGQKAITDNEIAANQRTAQLLRESKLARESGNKSESERLYKEAWTR